MANPEHYKIIKQGVKVWNEWREANPEVLPDLSEAWLDKADLRQVNFSNTDLRKAHLSMANFYIAILYRANLEAADLQATDFRHSNLRGANLSKAYIGGAMFNGALLDNTDFSEATINVTTFGDNDLRVAKGLDLVVAGGPSTIGIDAVYLSEGKIPEIFLKKAGVPDEFITYMQSLAVQPIQFYSCFISYSSKNQIFAERLYADLQSKGVRCWLASEDLKIGERIRIGIDESIRLHDKLLLVLSKNSIVSDWVEQEVETALARERREKRIVLFPIRLDEAVMKIDTGWPALIKNTRNIRDFRRWKNPDDYRKSFNRLLRDLKADDSTEGRGSGAT